MDCREAERVSDLSLDGEVEAAEKAAFDGHVSECGRCSQRFHSQSWFQNSLRHKLQESADSLPPPEQLKLRITAQLQQQQRRPAWGVPVAMAASVAAIAGITW